jgi:hypothetical protein
MDNSDFRPKAVEQPILDSGIRQRLEPAATQTDLPTGFYQANKVYIWAATFGLLVIGGLAYLAFRPSPPAVVSEANVEIAVDAPQAVASGGDLVYKININNHDTEKLVGMELELVYPSGVTYLSSSPKALNLSGNVFKVPDLVAGQGASLFVKTRAVGSVNEEKRLGLKLKYRLNNFNSDFVKTAEFTSRLLNANVQLQIEGPQQISTNQPAIYTVKYKNSSNEEIKNARLSFVLPEGFVPASANPPADLGQNTWNISSLASQSEGSVSLTGNFKSANAGESKTLRVEFLVLGDSGEYFVQASSEYSTGIALQPLSAILSLESSESGDIVKPGEFLRYKLRFQNNTEIPASGVNLLVTLDSKALDWSSVQAEGGQASNNTILWNASGVPALETLSPAQSGEVYFVVRVNNPATKDSAKNLTVVSNAKIKSNEYQNYLPGNEMTVKVSSPGQLTASVEYASGSLPPQVGKTTNFKIRLSLTNASNDMTDGLLTAFIPLGSNGFVSGSVKGQPDGSVQFDPSSGKLTWQVGVLPAHSGRFASPKALEFEVKLQASSAQVNDSPKLLTGLKFTAKDSFTAQSIEWTAEDIRTSDMSGQDGYTAGRVIP